MEHPITWLGYICLACGAVALVLIVRHLWTKPQLDIKTKLTLLVGLGLLPAASATTSTVTGMQTTTERHFCSSCHTMDPYIADASDPDSQSLAARHGRNPFFGDRNCYVCHADYGMLGYPMTKLNGMRHVYEFYLGGWKDLSNEEAMDRIHLAKPYDNLNCRQCHSGTLADWSTVPEHVALEEELDSNAVSCASGGCHGYAHPFTKEDGAEAWGLPESALGSDRPGSPVPSGLPPGAAEAIEAAKSAAAPPASVDPEAELERARQAAEAAKSKGAEPAPSGGAP